MRISCIFSTTRVGRNYDVNSDIYRVYFCDWDVRGIIILCVDTSTRHDSDMYGRRVVSAAAVKNV